MIDDFHPDLRRMTRFLPRGAVTPPLALSHMPVALRALARPRGVEVVRLRDKVGIRVYRTTKRHPPISRKSVQR